VKKIIEKISAFFASMPKRKSDHRSEDSSPKRLYIVGDSAQQRPVQHYLEQNQLLGWLHRERCLRQAYLLSGEQL